VSNTIFAQISEELKAHALSTRAAGDPENPAEWSTDRMVSALCGQLNIPYVCMRPEFVDPDTYGAYRDYCSRLRFLPLFKQDIIMVVASPEPWNDAVLRALRRELHMEVHLVGCTEQDFDRAFTIVDELHNHAQERAKAEAAASANKRNEIRILTGWEVQSGDYMSTVKAVVRRAHAMGASDIILDPMENRLSVRFRVLGSIEVMPPIGLEHRNQMLNTFKIFSQIANEEQRRFRSGRAELPLGPNYTLSLRVESQPSGHGDALVLRLLDPMNIRRNAGVLPFTGDDLVRVRQCLDRDDGIILVTGPTGSGKTTTLYRCLTSLDLSALNVRTIEDPIEYLVDRIVQTQVSEAATFAQALRSMVRADPDVILVGEIRDPETAGVAIEASLTGHLIISTLHTNDAHGALPRLEDLGVSPFLISTSLSLVIAQRLVPKLCPHCKIPTPPSGFIARHFEHHKIPLPATIYTSCGCKECSGTGVVGRIPVFEFLFVDDDIRSAMLGNDSGRRVRKLWHEQGGVPLIRSGLNLVAAGQTTYNAVRGMETALLGAG
jgi:type II secretory ATPase GspE/PulE/Tfp pilus assembly ATPase PilB-like protein